MEAYRSSCRRAWVRDMLALVAVVWCGWFGVVGGVEEQVESGVI